MTTLVQDKLDDARQRTHKTEKAQRFDLLRVPVVGRMLRWRWSRTLMQIPMLLLSIVMIVTALWGDELAPKNLGVLLTWVHFRGLVVLVLLLAGNFFCMACPFMLPREIARRFINPRWRWPRFLRNKWLSVACFVGVLFTYELFDLWGDPRWTGALIVGYFATAIIVDSLFERASFCKYVCPVGQFNFLSSTMSPLEVQVRDYDVCTACTTKDCIRGHHADADPHDARDLSGTDDTGGHSANDLPIVQRGCELALFQPRKVGNLDCTFCLDCVYACPHDNVGIMARLPGEELAEEGTRSGIGDFHQRSDWTALTIVFVFGALLNAFAMISPVYALEQTISRWTGITTEWPILGGLFFTALVLEPFILLGAAALCTRAVTHRQDSLLSIVNRFSKCLVPLGFGVWLAHYGFHFFTGFLTAIPVAQNAARQAFGWAILGVPEWQLGGLPDAVVYPLELGLMSLGLLGSLLIGWRMASGFAPEASKRTFVPWATLSVVLFASACWIMTQPMDMRGTFLGG